MRRLTMLAMLVVAGCWPMATLAQDHPLKGVALVIGESAYGGGLPALDNPKRDARAMDDLLDSLGFSVDRVLDGDRKKLESAIADFEDEAKGADVALVYYSGHGIEAGGGDYLVPVDADVSTPQTAGASLVPVEDLLDQLAKTVPVTIVLLDACRTDPFPDGQEVELPGTSAPVPVAPAGLEAIRGPAPVKRADAAPDSLGMVIGFAASPGEPALDGDPDGNSPYAAALLKHLGAGGYSFADVMTMVSEEVYLKTKAQQLPWTNSSLRRVLSFGKPAEPTTGDDAAIRDGRRQLLLSIAAAPDATRKYVETVATSEDVPLDALYGMLKVLGVDAQAATGEQLQADLLDGAKRLKDLMQKQPGEVKTDAELLRLSGLADAAEGEGAIDLALKYRQQASARADALAGQVDASEAAVKSDRIELGATYADNARTASLNFAFADAATLWGKAYDQVAKWDDHLAFTYRWREADALADQGNFRGDADALTQAIALYSDAEQMTQRGSADWAAIRNATGNAYEIAGERAETPDDLQQAAAAFQDALTVYSETETPVQWAGANSNLGVAQMYLGQREEGTDSLQAAQNAFADALAALDRGSDPIDWAHTQSNLGSVLQMLGDRTGAAPYFSQAADAQRAALEELTRDRVPLDWANAETNLGEALADLAQGSKDDRQDLTAAIDAFTAALEERTEAKVPMDWAATEDSLGSALATLGDINDDTGKLDEAIAAFTAALTERTRARAPEDWARTEANLGLAEKKLGERQDGTDGFDKAIVAYQAALTVFTRDAAPLDWAQTEADIGIAALARADRTKSRADLKLARDAYAAAYEVYAKMGDDYAKYFKGKLAEIDKRLKAG